MGLAAVLALQASGGPAGHAAHEGVTEEFRPLFEACLDEATTGAFPPLPDQECDGNSTAGATADILSRFAIDAPDPNFSELVSFTPAAFLEGQDDRIPLGAIAGVMWAKLTLGIVSNRCAHAVEAPFTMIVSSTDVSDTIKPRPFGQGNRLGPLAFDDDADGLPNGVERYPEYLNKLFDPDYDKGVDGVYAEDYGGGDDVPGPVPPLKPLARTIGFTTPFDLHMHIVVNLLLFPPGFSLANASNPDLPVFDSSLGYPAVIIVQDPTAPMSPGAISDFCSPLDVSALSFAITRDNPCTPAPGPFACPAQPVVYPPTAIASDPEGCDAPQRGQPDPDNNEAGCRLLRNPAAGAQNFTAFAGSQRDADGDGIENALDTCAYLPTPLWDPRELQQVSDPDRDGLPGGGPGGGCDPEPTSKATQSPANCTLGNVGPDYDQDCFSDRQDNCPIDFNDRQEDADLDGIGDACDEARLEASGHRHEVCLPVSITIGAGPLGSPGAAYSPPCRAAAAQLGGGVPGDDVGSPPVLAVANPLALPAAFPPTGGREQEPRSEAAAFTIAGMTVIALTSVGLATRFVRR